MTWLSAPPIRMWILSQQCWGLEQVAHQLYIQSESEVGTVGRPSYNIPPNVIEAHLLWGHTAEDIAQVFGVSERTIRRRMAQYGIR